jgi:transposase
MRSVPTNPDTPPNDLQEVLDQELARLPDSYRLAIVLCDLEGLSRRAAAERLQWSERTLAGRLDRGRKMLARRLSRYGLSIPAAGLGVSVANVPAALAESAVQVGLLTTAGVAGATSASVLTLTEGAMKGFLLTKLKAVAASLVIGCAVLATAVGTWQANAIGAGSPGEGRQKAARDADKDRIAELEHERDLLRKQVAELTERVAKLEVEKKQLQSQSLLSRNLLAAQSNYPGLASNTLLSATNGLTTNSLPAGRTALNSNHGLTGTLLREARTAEATGASPVLRVYPAGGLAATEKEAEALIRVIQKTVEPKSWQAVGGEGVIEYLAGKKVLVVRHTPAAHEKVAELLNLLQKSDPAKPGK